MSHAEMFNHDRSVIAGQDLMASAFHIPMFVCSESLGPAA
jgi:hypothetical protein